MVVHPQSINRMVGRTNSKKLSKVSFGTDPVCLSTVLTQASLTRPSENKNPAFSAEFSAFGGEKGNYPFHP